MEIKKKETRREKLFFDSDVKHRPEKEGEGATQLHTRPLKHQNTCQKHSSFQETVSSLFLTGQTSPAHVGKAEN